MGGAASFCQAAVRPGVTPGPDMRSPKLTGASNWPGPAPDPATLHVPSMCAPQSEEARGAHRKKAYCRRIRICQTPPASTVASNSCPVALQNAMKSFGAAGSVATTSSTAPGAMALSVFFALSMGTGQESPLVSSRISAVTCRLLQEGLAVSTHGYGNCAPLSTGNTAFAPNRPVGLNIRGASATVLPVNAILGAALSAQRRLWGMHAPHGARGPDGETLSATLE